MFFVLRLNRLGSSSCTLQRLRYTWLLVIWSAHGRWLSIQRNATLCSKWSFREDRLNGTTWISGISMDLDRFLIGPGMDSWSRCDEAGYYIGLVVLLFGYDCAGASVVVVAWFWLWTFVPGQVVHDVMCQQLNSLMKIEIRFRYLVAGVQIVQIALTLQHYTVR